MKTYNENQYDKELRKNGEVPPDEWTFTPKGLLAAAFAKKYQENVANNEGPDQETFLSIIDEVWSEYEQWCRTHFGKGSSVSGVIFDVSGGRFAELPTDPSEEDDLLN